MEDKISNENKKNEANNLSFLDFFLNDIDFMPKLKESISNQKNFISFITKQLVKLKESISNSQANLFNKMISKKIFSFLIKNSEELGLSFFSLLIEEKVFSKNIIFGFFFDDIFKEEIVLLIQKIIYIFNFDFEEKEIENPMYEYYQDLINYGIIQENDLKKEEKRESLTDQEQLFVQIESILFAIKKYRNLGNDVENDASEFFNSEIASCEQNLDLLKLNVDDISNATYEYYQEKIKKVKNFKDKKQEENQDKIENEEIKQMNKSDSSEEEEEVENNSPEKIKEDIKELRKIPLKERIYFYKDEQIIQDENESTEFKNYYFPLKKAQKDELARQFCAFINSNGGRLYIGINDLRIVKGVVTNKKVTKYEEKIMCLIKNFSPIIKGNQFIKFYAIPVKNNQNGKIIDNLFVFKVIIRKGDPWQLYSISTKEIISPVRLQGQSANLTAEEIHKEIIERNKKKLLEKNNNIIEDDFDMNDPAPLITQKIIDNEEKKAKFRDNKNNNNNFIKYYNKNINEDKKENKKVNEEKKENKINDEKKENKKPNEEKNINEEEENWNNNMNNKTKKKKKKKKNRNGIIRIEISNIDKAADLDVIKSLFEGCNYDNLKFFKQQNGLSSGYIDFLKEEDANNFLSTYEGIDFGGRRMKLNKLSFNIYN